MSAFEVVVTAGTDLGARILLDTEVLVGRGHEATLQLTDLSVSRRHLRIVPDHAGAHVQTIGEAAPFLWRGASVTEAVISVNDRIVVGDTALTLVTPVPLATAPSSDTVARVATSVRALVGDNAVEARGLSAIFSLSERLNDLDHPDDVAAQLAEWALQHLGAVAKLDASSTKRTRDSLIDQNLVEHQATLDGAVTLVIQLASGDQLSMSFAGQRAVGQDLRRLVVVAAALVSSARARLTRWVAARAMASDLRQIALGSAHTFLGSSEDAQRVAAMIPKLAASRVTLTILGETGVGKTFLARLVHESGPRAAAPFRVINCASIPEQLLESELFGHERGAFSGAVDRRIGALEAAGSGTVVLDEIGDLPLTSQAKLLRVLEERRFERLGDNRTRSFDARVIAATNRDLEAMVEEGTFRGDLFFRISVVKLSVAPLRERRADIPLLAARFLADLAQHADRPVDGFSEAALATLESYPWPGNVRELRNVVEHALVLGDGGTIDLGDLPTNVHATGARPETPDDATVVHLPMDLAELEERAIRAALDATLGNRTKAAALLGINRVTLYKKLKRA